MKGKRCREYTYHRKRWIKMRQVSTQRKRWIGLNIDTETSLICHGKREHRRSSYARVVLRRHTLYVHISSMDWRPRLAFAFKHEPCSALDDLLLDDEDGPVVGHESREDGLEPPVDLSSDFTAATIAALEHCRHDVLEGRRRHHLGFHGVLKMFGQANNYLHA